MRLHLGEMFQELAKHTEAQIVEGNLMADHVHVFISKLPKYTMFNVVGYLRAKARDSYSKAIRRASAEYRT
jgi:putative transposase